MGGVTLFAAPAERPSCTACNEDGALCHCPDACRIAEDDAFTRLSDAMVAAGLVLACVCFVLLAGLGQLPGQEDDAQRAAVAVAAGASR